MSIGGSLKGHQETLFDVPLPENPQEAQSLLALLHQLRDIICTPGQVLLYMDPQKTEVHYPLHTVPTIDEKGYFCLLPPIVYYEIFGLGGVQEKVILFAPC